MQDRATVLLLHGFTHTGASWAPVQAALGDRCRAIAPDIRGHGSASKLEPVGLDEVLADLASLTLPRFTLVGYSMGGRVALHAALAFPERVSRLVLVGASPGIEDPAERVARREADERLADEIAQMGIEQFAERWARTPVLARQPQWVQADRLRNTPAGLARALRGLGTGALPPLWPRLGELSMPVVLVVGERDRKFREIAGEMGRLIPQAQVVVVSGVGHAVHLEAPETIAEIITQQG